MLVPNRTLYLVASVYLQDNVGSSDTARIVIADTSGVTLANGNTITLSATWQRSTASLPLVRTASQLRIYIVTVAQHNTTFFADNLQLEILDRITATTYCDGAQGVNYEWDGTAHASVSRRRRAMAIIRGYTLHCTRDIYFAEDQTASSTTGRYIRAGTDFWDEHPLAVEDRLSFINVNAAEQPRVYGVVRGTYYNQKA